MEGRVGFCLHFLVLLRLQLFLTLHVKELTYFMLNCEIVPFQSCYIWNDMFDTKTVVWSWTPMIQSLDHW